MGASESVSAPHRSTDEEQRILDFELLSTQFSALFNESSLSLLYFSAPEYHDTGLNHCDNDGIPVELEPMLFRMQRLLRPSSAKNITSVVSVKELDIISKNSALQVSEQLKQQSRVFQSLHAALLRQQLPTSDTDQFFSTFCLDITSTKSADSNEVQFSRLQLFGIREGMSDEEELSVASIENPEGRSPNGESAANLLQVSTKTKWLDSCVKVNRKSRLRISFGGRVCLTGVVLYTGKTFDLF